MTFELLNSFQKIIKKTKSSHFIRDVAMVGGGIAAAQAIALLSMPFLTRLYGPEAFGVSAAFLALLNIITPLATMGYANAIIMPDSDEDASAVARLSVLCALILVPISLIIVHFSLPWLADWTGMKEYPKMLYLVPISLLFTALLSVANNSAIRALLFKSKARAYIESKLVEYVSKLIGGVLLPSGLLLIILTISGIALNFIMQIFRVPRQGVLKPSNWFGFDGVINAAKLHKDFVLFHMPQRVTRAASAGLPTIILAALFGSSAAGQYSIAILALGAPAMLLGNSVGEVFFPKITRAIAERSPNAYYLLLKVSLTLFLIGIIPFGIVTLWGSILFSSIFGPEWEVAGSYSQWLAIWLLINLVADASVATLPALNLQGSLLIRELILLGLRIVSLYIGFFVYNSDIVAIALFSIAGVLMNIYIIYIAFRKLFINNKLWALE